MREKVGRDVPPQASKQASNFIETRRTELGEQDHIHRGQLVDYEEPEQRFG